MTAHYNKGILLAILTALISGTANFANGMVVKGIDPLVHNVVKNGLVGLAVLAVIMVSADWKKIPTLTKKQWRNLGLIALIGGSLPFWLFFSGVKLIGGVEGSMIHKTLIFWVAFMAIPLLKEKVSLKMWVGIGLLYLSNFTAGFAGFGSLTWAHGMVLLATMMWAVENVIAKKTLPGVPVNLLVGARMFGGALILGGILLGSGKAGLLTQLTYNQWLMLAGVALLLFGYVMSWYRAISILPVTLVASILVGATIVTTVWQSVIVTQVYTTTHLGQALMVIGGIVLTLWGAGKLSTLPGLVVKQVHDK
jgi:drug/metabolite transporter (DMT)-like permease